MRPVPCRTIAAISSRVSFCADVHERRRRRRAGAIFAVAGRALRVVERGVVVRDQLDDPRHLVRVDEQQAGLRIERRAAPLAPPSKPGKHDRAFERRRGEISRLHLPEPLEHRRMRFRRARASTSLRSGLAARRAAAWSDRAAPRRAFSPSIADGGALRYSIGNSDAPVRRSSTNTSPNLVTCATASIDWPSRLTVTRLGGAGKSQSQTSCFNALEVPDALAGPRVEREHAVGEQVVAMARRRRRSRTTPIRSRRTPCRLLIDRDARPGIRAAGELVGVLRPGVVAEFPGCGMV